MSRSRRWLQAIACCALFGFAVVARADSPSEPSSPSGDAPAGQPRSRLTLSGTFTVDTFSQKNLLLGATLDSLDRRSDYDAFWAQELRLYPRLIVSDDLNVNLSMTLARGIWGLDRGGLSSPFQGSAYGVDDGLLSVQLQWAYLAYRHARTGTRWYLGRQRFALGNLLVLDENATGLQVYRDFPRLHSTLGLGLAKEFEGSNGVSDQNRTTGGAGSTSLPDGRDADLVTLEWTLENPAGTVRFAPFYARYVDRSNADGTTLLPDGVGYLDSRFRPNISKAGAFGASLHLERGALRVDAEYDKLSGDDRVANANSGPMELHDVNNGDLTGSNLYARMTLVGSRLELGGTFAQGSGDADLTQGEGNLNSLRSDGYFHVLEIWENGLAPGDEGYYPGGFGSPIVRGYRGLENTRILEGHVGLGLSESLKLSGAFALIRASEPIRAFSDANANGSIDPDEFTGPASDQLGSEIDARLDWLGDPRLRVSLRGGLFFPREAAGYLINGTNKFQEKARSLRLNVTVPIPEFSLGG